MDLADVAVFVEAVQAGSLAEAARRQRIAPMAATRRLAALELEMGVRLLHRTTRSLALTGEGEAFLPFARAMLEGEAGGRAAVRPSEAGIEGLLRVTASVPFGRKVVAPVIAAVMRAHPALQVDLLLTDSIVDIVAQGIDVAIRIAVMRDSSLVARRLADNPRCLYASPDYLAARGHPRRVADLGDHDCLVLTGVTHWSFTSRGNNVRQRIRGGFTASSIDALHQVCRAGLGIALLSKWDAVEESASGRLVPIALEDAEPDPLGIWAVYPSAHMVPPKVRTFVAALQARLAA